MGNLYDQIVEKLKSHRVSAFLLLSAVGIGFLATIVALVLQVVDRPEPSGRAAMRAEYCDLVAPLKVQLDRSWSAFQDWKEPDLDVELTLKDANTGARALLIDHAGLVTDSLQHWADSLIHHYDEWEREYNRLRVLTEPDLALEPFVFVFSFPQGAELAFRERYAWLKQRLGTNRCVASRKHRCLIRRSRSGLGQQQSFR